MQRILTQNRHTLGDDRHVPKTKRPYFRTPEESFAHRTRQDGECLIWTGSTNGTYGMIWVGTGEIYVHTYAWERANGPVPAGKMVDHRCHNKLCANAAHLRLATRKQNAQNVTGPRGDNTSGYLGVGWDKSRSKWIAYASINGKMKNLGRFDDVEEAARVAREARLAHYTHNDHDRA
jgi:HNH endonuclease/AP2 domain